MSKMIERLINDPMDSAAEHYFNVLELQRKGIPFVKGIRYQVIKSAGPYVTPIGYRVSLINSVTFILGDQVEIKVGNKTETLFLDSDLPKFESIKLISTGKLRSEFESYCFLSDKLGYKDFVEKDLVKHYSKMMKVSNALEVARVFNLDSIVSEEEFLSQASLRILDVGDVAFYAAMASDLLAHNYTAKTILNDLEKERIRQRESAEKLIRLISI